MLKTYIRDEMATLGRLGILSLADHGARRRDLAGRVVRAERHGCPAARLEPARRVVVEREEA